MMDNSPTNTKPAAVTDLPTPLPAERLRPTVSADSLGFETTDQLNGEQLNSDPLLTQQSTTEQSTIEQSATGKLTTESLPGLQTRALEAIQFGSSIQRPGHNVFALGAQRTGRHQTVLSVIEQKAALAAAPSDWVYVHNFASTYKPSAICLPPGIARPFAEAMAEMIDDLRSAIPAAFQADDYRDKQRAIDGEFEKAQEQGFEKIRAEAESEDITVMRTGLPDADIIVRVGRPKDVLLDIQQAINADLIIMAKHSQTGLDKLLGSTTNGVVNKAPCEVLVIPE